MACIKTITVEGDVGAAAAVVAQARRNLISHFMSCDAVSPAKAVSCTPERTLGIALALPGDVAVGVMG